MAIISIIVAVDKNNAIGKDNDLLCYLPNDLKYFKATTQGHTVIMGHNTYKSLPNGALPNRRNIVLSRNTDLQLDRTEIVNSLDEAIRLTQSEDEIFIMGGASVYKDAIELADRLYITHIDHAFEKADVYFPEIDASIWKETKHIENETDDKNKYKHTFSLYERK